MKFYARVSVAELLHDLSTYSMIWVPILCIVWLKYLPRLGLLFYMLSRLGSIRLGLACCLLYHLMPWQYQSRLGMHTILYLITPWQYQQKLGMLSYIISRLGSISRGVACYSLTYHTLAVSTKAWNAILYLHTLAVYTEVWHTFLYVITFPSPCSPKHVNMRSLSST